MCGVEPFLLPDDDAGRGSEAAVWLLVVLARLLTLHPRSWCSGGDTARADGRYREGRWTMPSVGWSGELSAARRKEGVRSVLHQNDRRW
eukprot:CAMPEP_0178572504 /NCGR_PEP_ID=MMETSP0697-20121206/18257_1 /TAXON_ID=265572 /ORGANISM="Extubocellulus spinifer, Strain CCMP396" /LENGTH=88 /DNA_ID=CAMNT_0020207235 /DNA_START=682 /DNA_END=945 /DNA_ORIENTATION=+